MEFIDEIKLFMLSKQNIKIYQIKNTSSLMCYAHWDPDIDSLNIRVSAMLMQA